MAEYAPACFSRVCPARLPLEGGQCGRPAAYYPMTFGPLMCFEHADWVRRRLDLQTAGSIAAYRAWMGRCAAN